MKSEGLEVLHHGQSPVLKHWIASLGLQNDVNRIVTETVAEDVRDKSSRVSFVAVYVVVQRVFEDIIRRVSATTE